MFRLLQVPETQGRVFMIVRKDAMAGVVFKTLPFKVYGFLKVVGESYENSYVAYMNLADEVNSNSELSKLEMEALLNVFE